MYPKGIETNNYKINKYTLVYMSKKTLAIELSKIKRFDGPKDELEQHITEPDIAAQALWAAHMNGLIKEKTIVDLGAGTGVLGIGCLLLGAKKVIFVEKDLEAISVLEENLLRIKEDYEEIGETEIITKDVTVLGRVQADLVVQNPPFGTRNAHIDKAFLEKAMEISDVIITMHKTETDQFIRNLFESNNFKVLQADKVFFPLRMTLKHHRKKTEHIRVTCWYARRNS